MVVAQGVPVYPFKVTQTKALALNKRKKKKKTDRSMLSSKMTRFVQECAFANQVRPRTDRKRAMQYFQLTTLLSRISEGYQSQSMESN